MRIIRNIISGAVFIYLYQYFGITNLVSFPALWTFALSDFIGLIILCILSALLAVTLGISTTNDDNDSWYRS